MAGSLRDLELVMDHNTKLASFVIGPNAGSSLRLSLLPSSSAEEDAEAGVSEEKIMSVPSHHQHLPNPLASLSLAFAPVPSFNPTLAKPRSSPPSKAVASSARKLPSQKKCISPSPLLPAINAVIGTMDVSLSNSSKVSVGSKKFSSAFPDYLRLPDQNHLFGNPSNAAALRRASIVWFRNDLRCHDNEALSTASKDSLSILPVYVFDPREYGKSSSGFDKTGPHRARFLLQCVSDLREKLRELGSELIVRIGKPEEVLLTLSKAIGAEQLYAHEDGSYEGMQAENKVRATLQEEGVDVKYFWGSTLFHLDDLPFKPKDLPATYSVFHEKVSNLHVRDTIETPKQLKGLPIRGGVKPGDMPSLEELGVKQAGSSQKRASNVATPLIGGEKEALQRLQRLVADHAKQSSNKTSGKDSLYGSTFSSKISPWLSLGCLSPRYAFEEFKNKGQSGALASMGSSESQKSPNWLLYELLWRDFFRFVTRKHAASRFSVESKQTLIAQPAGCT